MTGFSDAGAVERAVGEREIPAGAARVATIRTTISAPIAEVWAAVTEPKRMACRYLPVGGDPRFGGEVQIGEVASGPVLACDPPRGVRVSWAHADRPVDEIALALRPAAVHPDTPTELVFFQATVSTQVDWEGQLLDPLPDVGANWEYSLGFRPRYPRGELPEGETPEWFEFTPPVQAAVERMTAPWAALAADHRAG